MTIKDIAKEANVSIATVSRVINNYKWVSPELRERILAIIERENYRPSYSASMMATGKSKVIIIVVPDTVAPFFAQFTSVAAKLLKESGYAMVLVQTDNSAAEEESFFTGHFVDMADGLISVTDGLDDTELLRLIRPLRKKNKPVLFVDRYTPTYIADSIVHNTRRAVDEIMERLLLNGHQRIGLILGSKGQTIVKDKVAGYKDAMQRWGYHIDESLLRYGSWSIETGIVETQALLAMPRPVTAIIAGNNYICEGAVNALSRAGRVPGQDISLIGFEESDSDRRLFDRIGISTFQLQPSEMAEDACRYMLRKLTEDGDDAQYYGKEYPVHFVDRGSITRISRY